MQPDKKSALVIFRAEFRRKYKLQVDENTDENFREIPVSSCGMKVVHVPTQERVHRKKCLLPDSGKTTSKDPENLHINIVFFSRY